MKAILILSAFASAVASFVLGILYSSGALRLPIPTQAPPASVNSVQAPAPQAPVVPPAAAPAPIPQAGAPSDPQPAAAVEPERGGPPEAASPWSRSFRRSRAEDVMLRVTNESGHPVAVDLDRGCGEIALYTSPRGCLPVLRGCDVRSFRLRPGEYRIALDGCPMSEVVRLDPRRDYVLEVVPCEADPTGAMARLVEDGRVVFQTMLGGVPRHADAPHTPPMGPVSGR